MSQNAIILPTTGTFSGLTEQGYINSALDTLNTKFSGASAPGSPETGQNWLNNNVSGLQVLNLYDGADWLPTGVIDTSNHVWVPPVGGGSIPTIASASTTDLGGKPQARKYVSGTTTINSFGSSAPVGTIHFVEFTGALTVTASSAILTLGGTNMSVSASDEIILVHNGSGNWRIMYWSSGSGLPSIGNNTILSNISGGTATPAANTLSQVLDIGGATNGTLPYRAAGSWSSTGVSAILDAIVGSTYGGIAARGASAWGQTAVGTAGQVLTSNGAGALPTMQTLSAGEVTLLGTAIASSSSSLNFTSLITSAYDYYFFVVKDLTPSTGSTLRMRTSPDNGVTWTATSSYNWQNQQHEIFTTTTAVTSGSSDTKIQLTNATTATSFQGQINILNPLTAASSTGIISEILDSNLASIWSCYALAESTPANAVQFLPSTGNFASGSITMYGVKNT